MGKWKVRMNECGSGDRGQEKCEERWRHKEHKEIRMTSALDVGGDLGLKHTSCKYAGANNIWPSQQKCIPMMTILSGLVGVINLSPQVGSIGQLTLKYFNNPRCNVRPFSYL